VGTRQNYRPYLVRKKRNPMFKEEVGVCIGTLERAIKFIDAQQRLLAQREETIALYKELIKEQKIHISLLKETIVTLQKRNPNSVEWSEK